MTRAADSTGILVGVDGSEYSDAAVRWAVREAAMHEQMLTVMTVAVHQDSNTYETKVMLANRAAQRSAGERILAAAKRVVGETLGDGTLRPVQVKFTFLFAHPLATLIDESKGKRMVVVGCRGRGTVERLTLGSVSSGLLHHAHCPVAVIHKEHAEPDVHAPILLGVDGSPTSELATAIAFDEATHRRAPLIAMHAWADHLTSGMHLNWTIDEQEGAELLGERLAGWRDRYPDVSVTSTLSEQDAGRWLVNHSDKAQLIVVGSHGRGGFTGMLLGSVSSTVAHAAEVPVIVARRA
jgi:nucleotide-binding universal stress UspA family protein